MKIFILKIFFLVVAIGLFSCSSELDKKTEIRFWAMGSEAERVEQLLPGFYKENPNIKVIVQAIPWTAAQEKLVSAFAANNSPDLCQLGNTWIPQFYMLGALENLSNKVAKDTLIDPENYFQGIWKASIIDTNVFGIPWYIDTRVLFYRKDVIKKFGYDEPPKSWAEFLELCKKINNSIVGEGRYATYFPINEWTQLVVFALQNGADLLRDNNRYGNFNTPEFIEAFDYLTEFYTYGLSPVGISEVSNLYQAFSEKIFTFYISGPWNIPHFNKWMTGENKNNWGIAPLPAPDGNFPGYSLAGGSNLVIFKSSKNKEAAWKLINYLSRDEVQLKFYEISGNLPAIKNVWNDTSLSNNQHIKAFYEQFKKVKSTPKVAEWEQLAFSKIQHYIEQTARGRMTTKEAVKELDKAADEILDKRRWLLDKNE